MQKLSKAATGRSYTIQWMFGVPEVMDFLREHHVEEGDNIQIIRKLKDALIVGVKGSRFAMGNEIADRRCKNWRIDPKLEKSSVKS